MFIAFAINMRNKSNPPFSQMALPFNITIIVSCVHNAKCTVLCIVLWSAISKQCYAPFLFTHFHHFLSCQVKNILRDSFCIHIAAYWYILNCLLENWFYSLKSKLDSERVSKDLPQKCLQIFTVDIQTSDLLFIIVLAQL